MPVGVVDRLELVEVHEQQAHAPAPRLCFLKDAVDVPREADPVGQSRQAVVAGPTAQLVDEPPVLDSRCRERGDAREPLEKVTVGTQPLRALGHRYGDDAQERVTGDDGTTVRAISSSVVMIWRISRSSVPGSKK